MREKEYSGDSRVSVRWRRQAVARRRRGETRCVRSTKRLIRRECFHHKWSTFKCRWFCRPRVSRFARWNIVLDRVERFRRSKLA